MSTDLSGALEQSNTLREIYAALRAARTESERVTLLRRAAECVDALRAHIVSWSGSGDLASVDEETRHAISGLSHIMEQVMVLEKEYRISAGGSQGGADSDAHRSTGEYV